MTNIKKTFRVPSDWASRHLPLIFSRVNTYGQYKRDFAFLTGISGKVNEDGTATICLLLRSPCRPMFRIVGRRKGMDSHQRTDLRKILKMLTVAHNKVASAA
ncbi:MAG: hypothetical protein EBR82_67815 [Caulobacteraceae bacterium]|nr:hypothetical protein [Caulobacteraceae bacterium]